MKQFSKAMLVSSIVAATLASGSIVSADRGGEDSGRHRGWVKAGKEVKFIDARDAETNIEIKQDGTAQIRGAKVTSVSGNAITITETLGASVLTWTVTTDSATKLESKNGKVLAITDFTAGDVVTIKGKMQSGSALAVTATTVRNISKAITPVVVNTQQTFEGVLSVVPGAALPTSLTMTIGSTQQQVALSATTVVLNKDWTPIALSSFVAGDTVRVFGYIPANSSTLNAIVVRNTTR
jgi:hypothetical protein